MHTCRGIHIPENDAIIPPQIARKLRRDSYEAPEVSGLPRFLSQHDTVLELGAGIGFISSYMVKNTPVRSVTCVEANPVLCPFIREVHAANNITGLEVINAVALSEDQPMPPGGTIPFYIADRFFSSSLIEPQHGTWEKVDVPAIPLQDLLERSGANVIVADIEGGERDLFSEVDLDRVTHVYLELHSRVIGKQGIAKVFNDLHAKGLAYHQGVSSYGAVLFSR